MAMLAVAKRGVLVGEQVKVPSKNVESYTKVQPVVLSGTTLKYGPYSNIAPFKITRLRIHFEQNTPFAQVVSLQKEIEVSHWGNVYVEEIYELKHAGALHKVHFLACLSCFKLAHRSTSTLRRLGYSLLTLPTLENATHVVSPQGLYWEDVLR